MNDFSISCRDGVRKTRSVDFLTPYEARFIHLLEWWQVGLLGGVRCSPVDCHRVWVLVGCVCGRSRLPWVSVPWMLNRGSRTGVRLSGEGISLMSWAPASSWFSHLLTWLGVQFIHCFQFPLPAQAQLLQHPLPLHRQHWGGITTRFSS